MFCIVNSVSGQTKAHPCRKKKHGFLFIYVLIHCTHYTSSEHQGKINVKFPEQPGRLRNTGPGGTSARSSSENKSQGNTSTRELLRTPRCSVLYLFFWSFPYLYKLLHIHGVRNIQTNTAFVVQ